MKNIKKVIGFFCCLMLVFLMSGCVKSNTHMTVQKDKSMDFEATYMLPNYLVTLGNAENKMVGTESDEWKELVRRGYSLEPIQDDSYTGFKAKKHFAAIDDVARQDGPVTVLMSSFMEKNFDDTFLFSCKKSLFQTTYSARFLYDLTDAGDDKEMAERLKSMDISYSVTLPCKAITQNAQSVSDDGLTYSWKAPYGQVTEIEYSFSMPQTKNIYIAIGIAAFVFLGILVGVILTIRNKKQEKSIPLFPGNNAETEA